MRILFEINQFDKQKSYVKMIRHSARTIIIKNNLVALVYSKKYDYYKFPGGGIEQNETVIDAAIRETMEESGIKLTKESLFEFGIVKRKEEIDQKLFIQNNYYYLVSKYEITNHQQLDKYELDECYTLVFVDPMIAIATNRLNDHGPTNQTMLERDAKVLELLIEEGYFKNESISNGI